MPTERNKIGGVKESWSNSEIVRSAGQKPTIQCQFDRPKYYTVQFSADLRNSPTPIPLGASNTPPGTNDISFAVGPPRILRAGGNFITDGISNNSIIQVQGSASNDGDWRIVTVAANQLLITDPGFILVPTLAGAFIVLTYFVKNNPTALITWSTEGNSISRVVSVLNGMTISGLGSHVKVQVSFNRNPKGPVPITILVSPGTRPSQNQPPTLQVDPISVPPNDFRDILAYGTTAGLATTLHVEGGAISAAVYPWATAGVFLATDAEVSFINLVTGEVIRSWNPILNAEGFVPIPPGCDALRLYNHGAVNPLNYSVVVGIDG